MSPLDRLPRPEGCRHPSSWPELLRGFDRRSPPVRQAGALSERGVPGDGPKVRSLSRTSSPRLLERSCVRSAVLRWPPVSTRSLKRRVPRRVGDLAASTMLRPNRLLRVASPLPPSRADKGSPAVESWRFSVLEFSLATTPLDELEKVSESLGDPEVARLFEAHHEIEELGAIRTCHRVELLVLDRQGDPMEWRASLPGTAEGWRVSSGAPAVHHLHRVAAAWSPSPRENARCVIRSSARSGPSAADTHARS